MNAVIMSSDPNKKQSGEKAMKHIRAVVSDSVKSARLKISCIRLKISCTKPVKERQKFVSELCIGRPMARNERVTRQ